MSLLDHHPHPHTLIPSPMHFPSFFFTIIKFEPILYYFDVFPFRRLAYVPICLPLQNIDAWASSCSVLTKMKNTCSASVFAVVLFDFSKLITPFIVAVSYWIQSSFDVEPGETSPMK